MKGFILLSVLIVGLVALFYFGSPRAPHSVTVLVPVAAKVVPPAPVAAPVAPVAVEPIKAPLAKPVFHKVLKGGKQGAPVGCKEVKSAASAYTHAQVRVAMQQYGLTEAQIAALFVCLN